MIIYIELSNKLQITNWLNCINDKNNALFYAAENGYLNVIDELLKKGADVNAHDFYLETALTKAVRNNHIKTVELLLKKGAKVDNKNTYNDTDLSFAIRTEHPDIFLLLLDVAKGKLDAGKLKELIDCKDSFGFPVIIWAVQYNYTEIVTALFNAGADVNAKDKDGKTALMWAAMLGHREIAEKLINIENGADLNAKDNEGNTALFLATKEGEIDIVILLLDYIDTNPNIQNNYGWTPVQWAERNNKPEIRDLLVRRPSVDANTTV